MQNLINNINPLVDKELKEANVQFPMFNSAHEGYAIIKEEVEEAEVELERVNDELNYAWLFVKSNDNESVLMNIKDLKEKAILLAAESIQVAAMAQKFIDSSEKWGVK